MYKFLLFLVLGVVIVSLKALAPLRVYTTQKQTPVLKPEPQVKKHSPTKATLLSTFLPGAGQVYNRKNWWWKVPVIYGAGGALVYGAVFYNQNFTDFKEAYIYRVENPDNPMTGNARFDRYSDENLKAIRDSYREARDECIIGLVAVYALQIVDAAVEAHFFEFNVNDDLSLNLQPVYVPYGTFASAGIQFNLKFK
jgi:hypothetical protein